MKYVDCLNVMYKARAGVKLFKNDSWCDVMTKQALFLGRKGKGREGKGKRFLLCEDDGDGVIEDALTKHQHVEDRVHIEGIEYGNSSYRVHSWD